MKSFFYSFVIFCLLGCESAENNHSYNIFEETYDKYHFAWYAQPFIGYWEMTDVIHNNKYCYHFTDTNSLYVKNHFFDEYNCSYNFGTWESNKEKSEFWRGFNIRKPNLLWIQIDCGTEVYQYQLKGDSLFLYNEYYGKFKLKYKGKRNTEKNYKNWAYFSSHSLIIEPPIQKGQKECNYETDCAYQSVLHIGKMRKKSDSIAMEQSGHGLINYNFISFLLLHQELDGKEEELIELLINADQTTPQSMIDSVKNKVWECYPKIKISRVVWNKAEDKIETIRLDR